MALARRSEMRPRKEGQVCSRVSGRVGVEQVVCAGIILVDALLDQPHAENAGVEIQVLLSRPGNGRDVMQPVDAFHALASSVGLCRSLHAAKRGARRLFRGASPRTYG